MSYLWSIMVVCALACAVSVAGWVADPPTTVSAESVASKPTPAPAARVFEMRTYDTDNADMARAMHARFRDHTCRLFRKHGMDLVGFWIPRDEPTKLIYLLAFPSKEAAEASWRAFRDDPEWQRVFAESHEKAGGKIVTKVESVWLDPTDYSPIR
jgi:hypothetical protein